VKNIITDLAKEFKASGSLSRVVPFEAVQWRDNKPVWNQEICFKCGICYLSCPDAAIVLVDDGYYDVDGDRCKGCGVCEQACINNAIDMSPEKK
jgi:2-oxoacid:acceptor oxidoreductase delta subunit (pyruvate/2-ketoisovalerate family)